MSFMFDEEFDDEFEQEEDEFVDYLPCPACGSSVAVIEQDYVFGEVAHCKHDCGYRWVMLIEPDPCTFDEIDTFHSHIKGFENQTIGHNSKIVTFTGDLEEVYYEDKNRYNRILKYSDLNNTLLDGNSFIKDEDVPHNLIKKRQKFFERHALKEHQDVQDKFAIVVKDFLNGKDSLDNFLYVCQAMCQMNLISSDQQYKEFIESNKIIDVPELMAEYPELQAITYNEYSKNEFAHLNATGKPFDEFMEDVKNYLGEKYGIAFLYIKSEYDKYGGCRPLSGYEKEIYDGFVEGTVKSIDTTESNLDELTEKRLKELNSENNQVQAEVKSSMMEDLKNNPFYSMHTSYADKTILELHEIIKNDSPIAGNALKPFIIPLEDFYKNLESNMDIPSLIDFDNKIVFMSISHKAVIQTLNELNGHTEWQEYDDLEKEFHKENNVVEIFTSMVNKDNPKVLTYRIKNDNVIDLIERLDRENINHSTLDSFSEKIFITLNGNGIVSGEVYYPSEEEENIPAGKLLVVPTASEEYFLPALSAMEGQGCIITEKGSKTSHLVANSKEFNFNIILVEEATKLFKDGDKIKINLDDEEFVIE